MGCMAKARGAEIDFHSHTNDSNNKTLPGYERGSVKRPNLVDYLPDRSREVPDPRLEVTRPRSGGI